MIVSRLKKYDEIVVGDLIVRIVDNRTTSCGRAAGDAFVCLMPLLVVALTERELQDRREWSCLSHQGIESEVFLNTDDIYVLER